MLTVGADIGKYKTKIKWKGGQQGHLSKIAYFREIKDSIQLDEDFIVIEYDGKSYLAGLLAEREGQNFLNSPDIHKSNLVTLLNLLIELSRLPSDEFNVVVGNPFGINVKKERENIKQLLIGTKEFKVNGQHYKIHIRNVGIAPEGVAAWYSCPVYDDINIWDFGSSTIHAIAIRGRKLLDKRSHTFNDGFETMVDHNYPALMEYLRIQMEKKWNDGDKKMMLVGGKALDMFQYVKQQYPNCSVILHNNAEFANAIGMYEMGVIAFERTN